MYKVIRSNIQIAITRSLKFGTEFHHVADDTPQMFKVKMAMDRLSDSKLGMGVVYS